MSRTASLAQVRYATLCFAILAGAHQVVAATFNVASGDVAGLVAAMTAANGSPGSVINLAPGSTYTLTAIDNTTTGATGLPVVTTAITINGNNSIIQRANVPASFLILSIVSPGGDLTLNRVTITGGDSYSGGGGINNSGGIVRLAGSTVAANTDHFFGGGIFNAGDSATLIATDSSIRNNSARLRGGGIWNDVGSVTLINSTLSANDGAAGGGILNWPAGSRLTLINSTVSGNTGGGGGGIQNDGGTTTLSNSTVTGNTDTSGPGGAAIYNFSGTTTLKNTIVSGNSPNDCTGAIVSLGHNLAGGASCALSGTGDRNNTYLSLGPLAYNGGPTFTHTPFAGPAIDGVPLADCTDANGNPLPTDQRGISRPKGTACDIGAVELTGKTVSVWGVISQVTVPPGLTDVMAIAGGGYHSLALKTDSSVVAWGSNGYGQANVPPGLAGVVAISGGYAHSMALKSDGTVVAWGFADQGVLNVPPGLSGVIAIGAGRAHSVALKSDGTVVAWGAVNSNAGQLDIPAGLNNVIAIAAGGIHTLALKSDGTVVAWGAIGSYGQAIVPPGLSNVIAIAAGDNHSLALKSDGTMVAWGNNGIGAINVPSGLTGVVAIAGGSNHSLALKSDGAILGWGDNQFGQTTAPAGLTSVMAIAGGSTANSSYAIALNPTVQISLSSSPEGLSFTVDGSTYSTPQNFNWVPGSSHTIATTTPQGTGGTRYVFNNWPDGGAISHGVTAPASATSYTASFTTQYLLTTPAGTGGSVSGGGWYDAASTATVTASANNGYAFSSWTGATPSGPNTGTVVMDGPKTVTANFTALIAVTVVTAPTGLGFTVDGTPYTAAHTSYWTPGSSHIIATASPQAGAAGTQYVFANWSDAGALSHSITAPASSLTYTANFKTQYLLTTVVNPAGAGTITGAGYYDSGALAPAIATANAGYKFSGWTGPVTSVNGSSAKVSMTAAQTVTANFQLQATVSLSAIAGQYSDVVTLRVILGPPGAVFSGSLQFQVAGANAGSAKPVNGPGTYTGSYTITNAAGVYRLTAIFSSASLDVASGSSNDTLTVSKEDATVTPSATNPQTVQVNTRGGTAGPIVLKATVKEPADGSPGNLSLAAVTVSLVPQVGTAIVNCPVVNLAGALTATCSAVPVNVYDVQWKSGGSYYQGPQAVSALAVSDPSLGSVASFGTLIHNGVASDFLMGASYLNGKVIATLRYTEHRVTGNVTVTSLTPLALAIVGGKTAIVTSTAARNGVPNYTMQAILGSKTGLGNADQLGLLVTDPSGAVVADLTFPPLGLKLGAVVIVP